MKTKYLLTIVKAEFNKKLGDVTMYLDKLIPGFEKENGIKTEKKVHTIIKSMRYLKAIMADSEKMKMSMVTKMLINITPEKEEKLGLQSVNDIICEMLNGAEVEVTRELIKAGTTTASGYIASSDMYETAINIVTQSNYGFAVTNRWYTLGTSKEDAAIDELDRQRYIDSKVKYQVPTEEAAGEIVAEDVPTYTPAEDAPVEDVSTGKGNKRKTLR